MSRMTVCIMDQQQTLHGRPRMEMAEFLVSALAAEPETIAELAAALRRYPITIRRDPFAGWLQGVCDEPAEAGLCLIDLAARLVVWHVQAPSTTRRGGLQLRAAPSAHQLRASLPPDWHWCDATDDWRALSQQRREQWSAPLDARSVLYDGVMEFVAQQILDFAEGRLNLDGSALDRHPSPAASDTQQAEDRVAEIHARWLLTAREDLGGRAPRDVILEKREHLDADLQDRAEQWTQQGECPSGLDADSQAYRYSGFSTPEIVLYYDLVRHLVQTAWDAVRPDVRRQPSEPPPPPLMSAEQLLALLQTARSQWMEDTTLDGLCSETPARIIDLLRRRIPWTVTPEQAVIDHDCPLCRMAFEQQSGPLFWHLDACNFDADFAFSLFSTREEYQAECQRMEEMHQEMQREHLSMLMEEDELPELVSVDLQSGSVWKKSFAYRSEEAGESFETFLFGVGCHLGELITELKCATPGDRRHVDALNRQFDNILQAARDNTPALLAPVIDRFCDELRSVGEQCPAQNAQCQALEEELRSFEVSW